MGAFCSDASNNPEDERAQRHRIVEKAPLINSAEQENDERDRISAWETALNDGTRDLVVSLLTENSDDLLDHKFSHGDFAVHVCAKLKGKKQTAIMNDLLIFGDDLTKKNRLNGNTALHYAVQSKNLELVNFLKLKAPEIIEIRNNKNELPYDMAVKLNDGDLIEAVRLENGFEEESTISEILNAGRPKIECARSIEMMIEDEPITLTETKKPSNLNKVKFVPEERKQEEAEVRQIHTNKIDVVTIKKPPKQLPKPINQATTQTTTKPTTQVTKNKNNDNEKEKNELKSKEGWLEKYEKKLSIISSVYSDRYVIVKKNYLLWSDKEKHIKNIDDKKQRDEFNRCFPFRVIQRVEPVITKNNTKFEIFISRDPRTKKENQFTLKAKNKNERDNWVDIINQHIESIKRYDTYLEG